MRLFTQDTKVESLKRAPLFAGLSKAELKELTKVTDDLSLDAGTVLCREGTFGSEFFAIVDGTVDVTRRGKKVAIRGGVDFFGEIALLTDAKRTATVTAKTPVRCFVLTKRDFQHVLDENPKVERKVMHALAERLLLYTQAV